MTDARSLLKQLLVFFLQVVNSSGNQDNSSVRALTNDEKSSQMTSKPKTSGEIVKKHKMKMDEPKVSDSFHELFGTPITKTSKISPDPQKMAKKDVVQQKSEKGRWTHRENKTIVYLLLEVRLGCFVELSNFGAISAILNLFTFFVVFELGWLFELLLAKLRLG